MSQSTHFIVSRWRSGWAVSAGADRLSVHADLENARREARRLAETARQGGAQADLTDLTDGEEA